MKMGRGLVICEIFLASNTSIALSSRLLWTYLTGRILSWKSSIHISSQKINDQGHLEGEVEDEAGLKF